MPARLSSVAGRHAEWLALLDVTGPFLDLGVVAQTFPQGLDGSEDDGPVRRRMQMLYETRLAAQARRRSGSDPALEAQWFDAVIRDVLDWPETHIRQGKELPPEAEARVAEHNETLRPDLVLLDRARQRPIVLVSRYGPGQDLNKPAADRKWTETPANRMVELLRQLGAPALGLVTNGEAWMVVTAPAGQPSGFGAWYANLWFEEHETFVAFRALLGGRRIFGVPDDETLPALLDRSRDAQTEVTTQLGSQVREAVELLVAGIDRADAESGGALLAGIPEETVYEAALTVMMRIIFLLYAEDQRPPLFGGDGRLYDQSYSVTSLFAGLREAKTQDIAEVLEQKHDAWSRLLATFRLVHGGSAADEMPLPAYGGSLFDPDRFPFLEGRVKGSDWRFDRARPLAITNRDVLHMLEAVMLLEVKVRRSEREPRRVSFRALDVEQIGHVYEQLLEHTCRRAEGIVLGLTGTTQKGVKVEPEVALTDLETWTDAGIATLARKLKEVSGPGTVAAVERALATPDPEMERRVRQVIPDPALAGRVCRFAGLIRRNRAGRAWIVLDRGLYVTQGDDRRTTGAHYTPRSLTEPIVQYALEPVIYHGPAEGLPRAEWTPPSPQRVLQTTVCDPAMGSGAFLVQTARYLGERLVEAWNRDEEAAQTRARVNRRSLPDLLVAPDGALTVDGDDEDAQPLPPDPQDRLLLAQRMVVDHCLYGVDVNPLAVEMAKLSLWLVTLQRDRPFTFLDHRLRCGDSLLGLASLDQLRTFSLSGTAPNGGWRQMSWFVQQTKEAVDRAIRYRRQIEALPSLDVEDSDEKAALLLKSEQQTGLLTLGADLLVGSALGPDPRRREAERKRLQAEFSLRMDALSAIQRGELIGKERQPAIAALNELRREADRLLGGHRPFHWPLEFPEVFVEPAERGESPGFAAMVGNPPFLGGSKITGAFGTPYRDYLVQTIADGKRGNSDLAGYFFLRVAALLRNRAEMGLVATNTIAQGDTREVSLDRIANDGCAITRAVQSVPWPGIAALEVAHVWIHSGNWDGDFVLDGENVEAR